MTSPREVIAHLKTLIYCILAGAEIVSAGWDRRLENGDYKLTVTIKHQNGSGERSELIQEHSNGLSNNTDPNP